MPKIYPVVHAAGEFDGYVGAQGLPVLQLGHQPAQQAARGFELQRCATNAGVFDGFVDQVKGLLNTRQ